MKCERKHLEIRFSIPRERARIGLLITLLLSSAYLVGSETLTLNTYYPSPLGIYKKLTSTDQTVLARDAGSVTVGSQSHMTALTINGPVQMGTYCSDPSKCSSPPLPNPNGLSGAIVFDANGANVKVSDGAQWKQMGGNGWTFGGMYSYPDAGGAVNPFTGDYSCPAGFTDYVAGTYGQAGGTFCYGTACPITLHFCSK